MKLIFLRLDPHICRYFPVNGGNFRIMLRHHKAVRASGLVDHIDPVSHFVGVSGNSLHLILFFLRVFWRCRNRYHVSGSDGAPAVLIHFPAVNRLPAGC